MGDSVRQLGPGVVDQMESELYFFYRSAQREFWCCRAQNNFLLLLNVLLEEVNAELCCLQAKLPLNI